MYLEYGLLFFFANIQVWNLRVKINLYCRDFCMNIVNTWNIWVTPNHTTLKGLLIACALVLVQVVDVCRSDGTPAAHLNVYGLMRDALLLLHTKRCQWQIFSFSLL